MLSFTLVRWNTSHVLHPQPCTLLNSLLRSSAAFQWMVKPSGSNTSNFTQVSVYCVDLDLRPNCPEPCRSNTKWRWQEAQWPTHLTREASRNMTSPICAIYWRSQDGLDSEWWIVSKWKLKCENILECELATLSESRQCKKLISWSGDDGMDLVVSWGLTGRDITLETLWSKFKEFCKLQANEVRARFDLLTSFWQGDKSVDKWFNTVQAQINLCNYPTKTANILHQDIFWFYMKDEEFVSKTLNEGCADLQQYPTSKIRQLAKKLEFGKATAQYIKQATSNAHAAQINLLCCTELTHSKKKGLKCKKTPPIQRRQATI